MTMDISRILNHLLAGTCPTSMDDAQTLCDQRMIMTSNFALIVITSMVVIVNFAAVSIAAEDSRPPNIVLIAADDNSHAIHVKGGKHRESWESDCPNFFSNHEQSSQIPRN